MSGAFGIGTIVTEAFVDEFEILKYSFELFHGPACRWFVRCDRESLSALSAHANLSCVVFTERHPHRTELTAAPFQRLMLQKMYAMEDAWAALGPACAGVFFLDTDLIFTAPLIHTLAATDGDAIVVPNYYPEGRENLVEEHGAYNAGFVFSRQRAFVEWWRTTYEADPAPWNDQRCLNEAHERFMIGTLPENANIGFWRTKLIPAFNEIPADCSFLHVHLYQSLLTPRQWLDKSFALHCVRFLMTSGVPEQQLLFDRILAVDRHGWFEASLRACGLWDPVGAR